MTLIILTLGLAQAADAEAGKTTYAQMCAMCHGAGGAGDGAASAALDPKPANFTSADFQSSRTDDDLIKVIREGGAATGKSPTMPPFGGAIDAAKAADIVAYLRTLKE